MRKQKFNIVVIICYYGEFPWYFSYFLHSCRFNPSIDFMIISDTEYSFELSGNIIFKRKSFEEVKKMASKKMGFEVAIDTPYKLCEFKPAYGLIFSDLIEGYDFWGQSDLDNIFGNIRSFLNDGVLGSYDFISVRHDYTTGCFTVHRNNDFIKNIFKRSKDYRKVYSSAGYFGFDEFNFRHHLIHKAHSISEVETEIETFTHVIKLADSNNELKAYFDFILLEGVPGKIRFDKGRIIYNNKFEAILYHLYWLKKVYDPLKAPSKIPDIYFISPTRVYYPKKRKTIA